MDRFLNNIIGENFFDNYSLSDGISAVSTDGRTYEFKYVGPRRLGEHLKKASQKADVAFAVTVESKRRSIIEIMESLSLEAGHEVIVVNADSDMSVEGIYKKTASSVEPASAAKITGSQPDTLKSRYPFIDSLLQKLPDVNSNSQETMD